MAQGYRHCLCFQEEELEIRWVYCRDLEAEMVSFFPLQAEARSLSSK